MRAIAIEKINHAAPYWCYVAFILLLLCSVPAGLAMAQNRPSLPSGPIKLNLTNIKVLIDGKYGRREIQIELWPGSDFKLRGEIWTLLGEPVMRIELKSPQLHKFTLASDAGYDNLVNIISLGEKPQSEISDPYGSGIIGGVINIYVSQDVMDLVEFVDLSYSFRIYNLSPLPDDFYSEKNPKYTYDSKDMVVYFHERNPGVIGRAGKWGWDVAGSPDWGNFLSPYEDPLSEGQYELPEDRRLPKREAKEAFKRMLWCYHNEDCRDLFGSFDIQNLRVNASGLLAYIYKHKPETYRAIIRREKTFKRDAQMTALMAGLTRVGATSRDDLGTIITTQDVTRRLNLIDKAFSAFDNDIGYDVKQEWKLLRRSYTDAYYRQELSKLRDRLDALQQNNFKPADRQIKQAVEKLKSMAQGLVSPVLMARIQDVERLVNASPIIFTSHQNGQTVKSRVIEIKGKAKMAANDSLILMFNGAEQLAKVTSDGDFAAKAVMKAGQNDVQGCYGNLCVPLSLYAKVPKLGLMATLTWVGGGDLDLHVETPSGAHCYYSSKKGDDCLLDIDDTKGRNPENISVPHSAQRGDYRFWVINFSDGSGSRGELKLYREGTLIESRRFTVGGSKSTVTEIRTRF